MRTCAGGQCKPLDAGGLALPAFPYVPRSNVYKGQLHFHSTNSDGVDTPAAIVTGYRDAGYDFCCLTDHVFITPDPVVPGILYFPGTEENTTYGHLGGVYVSSRDGSTHAQTIINSVNAGFGLTIINHPDLAGPLWTWTNEEIASVYGYKAVEIWNSQTADNAEPKWDFALSSGVRSLAVATDDCHDKSQVLVFATSAVHAFADVCNANLILDALQTGNYYSTYTPPAGTEIGMTITMAGNIITAIVDTISTIEFIGINGTVLQTNIGVLSANYTVVGGEQYVRIRATAGGVSLAWSNPIWV